MSERRDATETERAELKMHAVRLMRSGNLMTAKAVSLAMEEDFPEISRECIKNALAEVARKMVQHLE